MIKEVSHTEACFDHEKFHRSPNQSWRNPNLQVPIEKLCFQLDEIAKVNIEKDLNKVNKARSRQLKQNLNT